MGLLRRLIGAGIERLGHAIDRFAEYGDPPTSVVMSHALRRTSELNADLAQQVVHLNDEVDRMALELEGLRDEAELGTKLYSDEVDSVEAAIEMLGQYDWGLRHSRVLQDLLLRSTRSSMTLDEEKRSFHEAIMGLSLDGNARFDPDVSPDGDLTRPAEIPAMPTTPTFSKIDRAAAETCTCNEKFRTAEDWRDHLPCNGSSGK